MRRIALLSAATLTLGVVGFTVARAAGVTVCTTDRTTVADQRVVDHSGCVTLSPDTAPPSVPNPGVPTLPTLP